MKHISKQIVIPIVAMILTAAIMLFAVSILSYIYKWQADKALVGITITYIATGFIGGVIKKKVSDETDITKRLLEGIVLGSVFMFLLIGGSILFTENSLAISSRFLMIWMLITGSASLGRIL